MSEIEDKKSNASSSEQSNTDYKKSNTDLHIQSSKMYTQIKEKIINFITDYGESINLPETQKKYFDLKEEIRDCIFIYKNKSNIIKNVITSRRAKLAKIYKAKEMDSYKDKDSFIEFKLKDLVLFKDSLDLFLSIFRSLLKDVENLSYHFKNI